MRRRRRLPRVARRRDRTRTGPCTRHRLLRAGGLSYYCSSVTRPSAHGAGVRIQLSPTVVIVSGPVRTANGRRAVASVRRKRVGPVEINSVLKLICLAQNGYKQAGCHSALRRRRSALGCWTPEVLVPDPFAGGA